MEEKWRKRATEIFSESSTDILYVIPYQDGWNPSEPQRASSLKMKKISYWPRMERLTDNLNTHFVCIDVKQLSNFPAIHTIVMQKFISTIESLEGTEFMRRLSYEVSSCVTDVEKYQSCIEPDGMNEAAIRVIYANAVTYMICTLNNYYYRLEHRMLTEDDSGQVASSDIDVTEGISEGSVADYICYSVHDERRLITVIMETKQNFTINALAQLLGYYYRAGTSQQTIGLCLLLTRKSLHIILCPFGDENGGLLNAICLKEIKLDDLHGILYLLAIITSTSFRTQPFTMLLDEFLPMQKRFQFFVESEEDKRARKIEHLVKELQEQVIQLQRDNQEHKSELSQLKCRFLPVQVNVTRHQHFKQ